MVVGVRYFINNVGFTPVAYGDTDEFEVDAAMSGMAVPLDAKYPLVVDEGWYSYSAKNSLGEHEEGDAQWDSGTDTLLRQAGTVRNGSSGPGVFVDFTSVPNVIMGGPLTQDVPHGATALTTGAAPVELDARFPIIYITTGGTGEEEFTLPAMTRSDSGFTCLIILAAKADPGDSVVCNNADQTITLIDAAVQYAIVRWDSAEEQWIVIDAPNAINAGEDDVYMRNSSGAFFLNPVSNIFSNLVIQDWYYLRSDRTGAVAFGMNIGGQDTFQIYIVTDVGTVTIPDNDFSYWAEISSNGGGNPCNIAIANGIYAGERKLINYFAKANGGDTVTIDVTNIEQNGIPVISITLTTTSGFAPYSGAGDQVLLEWRMTHWEVITATPGIVT